MSINVGALRNLDSTNIRESFQVCADVMESSLSYKDPKEVQKETLDVAVKILLENTQQHVGDLRLKCNVTKCVEDFIEARHVIGLCREFLGIL